MHKQIILIGLILLFGYIICYRFFQPIMEGLTPYVPGSPIPGITPLPQTVIVESNLIDTIIIKVEKEDSFSQGLDSYLHLAQISIADTNGKYIEYWKDQNTITNTKGFWDTTTTFDKLYNGKKDWPNFCSRATMDTLTITLKPPVQIGHIVITNRSVFRDRISRYNLFLQKGGSSVMAPPLKLDKLATASSYDYTLDYILTLRAKKTGAAASNNQVAAAASNKQVAAAASNKQVAAAASNNQVAAAASNKVEQKKLSDEDAKKAELKRLSDEDAKKAELKRLSDEDAKKAELKRLSDEDAKTAELKRLSDEDAKKAELKRLLDAAAKKAAVTPASAPTTLTPAALTPAVTPALTPTALTPTALTPTPTTSRPSLTPAPTTSRPAVTPALTPTLTPAPTTSRPAVTPAPTSAGSSLSALVLVRN